MKNKYLIATLLALLAPEVSAQRLLVSITIEGLNAEKMIAESGKSGSTGFRKLMERAMIYEKAVYPFTSVDQASSIAALVTGTTPHYNGITANRWYDVEKRRSIGCTDDETPGALLCSTLTDELKVSTNGVAQVFSIAYNKETAILSAGHAANAAIWRDEVSRKWRTSTYYSKKGLKWLETFKVQNANRDNSVITKLALQCIDSQSLGSDEVCDILSVNFDEDQYDNLDRCVGSLVDGIENKVGAQHVIFCMTGTSNTNEAYSDVYQRMRIPTGTFYINRTASLLNMYLGALYGRNQYVEAYYRNHIFLDKKIIEQRHINNSELLEQCRTFLLDCDGVVNVRTAIDGLFPHCGELEVEIRPGWNLLNEDTGDRYQYRCGSLPVPVIIYGPGIKAQRINTIVTLDRLAPTLAGCIHIRAPNACTAKPLF